MPTPLPSLVCRYGVDPEQCLGNAGLLRLVHSSGGAAVLVHGNWSGPIQKTRFLPLIFDVFGFSVNLKPFNQAKVELKLIHTLNLNEFGR
jgi:hypothetical protein